MLMTTIKRTKMLSFKIPLKLANLSVKDLAKKLSNRARGRIL